MADNYHYYTRQIWGASANYHLSLDTSLGYDYVMDVILETAKRLKESILLVIMTKKLYNNLEIHTSIVFSGRCLLSLNISKGASNNERIEMGSTGHRRDCQ